MTDRIDHAAKARDGIEWGDEWLRATGDTDAAQLGSLMIAQAHAALALAEQARIANLIALAESGRTTVNGARAALSGLYTGRAEDGSANMTLRPDIAAALGIETGAGGE